MKTDLLKIIRKRYRIVVNDLGETKIQEKFLFWFEDLDLYTKWLISQNSKTRYDELIKLIRMNHSKYCERGKLKKQKRNNWKVIWWKN